MSNVKLAVIDGDRVENLIVGDVKQINELSASLGKQVIYNPAFDLAVGDMRVDGNWTRNIDGVQTVLSSKPLYSELQAQAQAAQAQLEAAEAAMLEGVNSIG